MKELIETLAQALVDARDHLDYCGYGDSYERECAESGGLPETIERALENYRTYKASENKALPDEDKR